MGDEHPELGAPVPQVVQLQHPVAQEGVEARDALSDDGGPEGGCELGL